MKPATSFKAASIEFNPKLNDLDDNIQKLKEAVTEAASNGAKLIVTPEMATTGYHYEDRKAISPYVDTIPGKTTMAFEEIARKYDTYIVIGMAEIDKEDGLYYNSAVLIGPKGYIGKYRKIHLWAVEDNWASGGNLGVPVFETEIGNISIIICMDSSYFESARVAAVNGANILCFPTNSTGGSISMLQAWAEMNGMYVVGANRSNTEDGYHMVGASAIWSPEGKKLAESPYIEKNRVRNSPTIIYADIDPAQYDNDSKRRIKKRRPDIYYDLMLHGGPWKNKKQKIGSGTENIMESHVNFSAGLVQYTPDVGDKNGNLKKINALLSEASIRTREKGSVLSLFVFPELSLIGPVNSLEVNAIFKLSETMDGLTVNEMKRLAKKYKAYIAFGMIEREGTMLFNTAVLLKPNGQVGLKVRKIHLTDSEEQWATPGEEIKVKYIKGLGNVGLMVGYDASYPELAGIMAIKHAEFIIIPSIWSGEFGQTLTLHPKMMENNFPLNSMTTWDAVARFSQTRTLIANFTGTEQKCKGGSALYTLDPIYSNDIPFVASSHKEEVFIVKVPKIQTDWWFDQQKLRLSRRPHFYHPLILDNSL
ncbi:nitrilase-related carbon-nitrogen hydrolase [Siminovitchia fortis]|uniref:Nitrilase n=1 Tax=Siminovitchia fortis TaxID=254758 RepID=A0A443IZB1_9BACI|nr:nitrilase-related carbon-nitrogen hydrolase [Siminovitchia fortis]RWR13652.1 nitrilase [Siminovitchia fortis]WHY81884.1 nitrilase-related carbon-nitrogen hydrolase [Siminovitchia fortis]